jgi:hypothetical protein
VCFSLQGGKNWPILGDLRSVDLDLDGSSDSETLANLGFELSLIVLKPSNRQVIANCMSSFSHQHLEFF